MPFTPSPQSCYRLTLERVLPCPRHTRLYPRQAASPTTASFSSTQHSRISVYLPPFRPPPLLSSSLRLSLNYYLNRSSTTNPLSSRSAPISSSPPDSPPPSTTLCPPCQISGILCSNCVLDHRLGKNYSTEPVPSSFNCPTSIKQDSTFRCYLLAALKQNFASETFAAYSSSPAFAQTTASSESASSRPPAFSPPPLFYRPYCTYATAALLPKPLLPKTLPPPPPHSPPQFWMLAFRGGFFSGYASVKISYRYVLFASLHFC
ncbi:hypothetical protein IWX46DRAFT_335162 [Phyllosticta citricarpa]|uniref:Uncharacterized protein n=1 Tax=Phyllosticta citricarpa TaxID=55181 RepID=A0ABR1LC16_9PEZI